MGYFKIVVPEAGTNLVKNPSAETTGNYSALSATVSRSTTYQKYGLYSYRVQTAADNQGLSLTLATLANAIHYVTMRVRGTLPAAWDWSLNNSTYTEPTLLEAIDANWNLYGLQFPAAQANGSTTLYIRQKGSGSGDFYLDGIQVEEAEYWTTYIDGSLAGNRADGYLWTGAKHASSSTRHAQERSGGRVRDVTDDLGASSLDWLGSGVPPQIIHTDPLPLLPGERFQEVKVQSRYMDWQLTFTGATSAALLDNRKTFYDAIKLSRVHPRQPFLFRFTGATTPKELAAYYAGGMEQSPVSKTTEQPTVRVFSPQPYWRSLGNGAASLGVQQSVSNANRIIKLEPDGTWSALGSGLGNEVYALAEGPDGIIYIAGFSSTPSIMHTWDGTSLTAMTGYPNSTLTYNLAVDPAGNLWTVTLGYVYKWNGSSWTTYVVAGGSSKVFGIAIGNNGYIYVCGSFTAINSVSATNVAYFDGSSWNAMSTGLDDVANDLAVASNGNIVACGKFTGRVKEWDGSSWSTVGDGFASDEFWTVEVAPNGDIYVGGESAAVNYIRKYDGSQWRDLAGGIGGSSVWVRAIEALENGRVLVGGINFDTMGGITVADSVGIWSNGVWLPVGIDLPGTAEVYALLEASDGSIYFAFTTGGTATAPGKTTASNGGSAETYPRLVMSGPGRVHQLRNTTVEAEIFFDLALVSGETATLNLDPNNPSFVSDFRGNIWDTILNGSDVTGFRLLPGDNDITLYVDDGSATAYMIWPELWEAADG